MAEELQSLLERIQSEGVKKADDQKEQILSDAKAQAEKIIADAKNEAEALMKSADEAAGKSEARAKSAIQQASRDILLALKSDLQSRLEAVVKECAGAAMTPELMKKFVDEMVSAYKSKGVDVDAGVEVLLNQKDAEEMAKLLQGGLLNKLKATPEISISKDFTAGLQVGFKGDEVFLDLSDDALTDLVCAYVGPKLAALIQA